MKKTSEISSPLIPIGTGIGIGAIALIIAAISPPLWPLLIPGALLIHKAAKDGFAYEVESTVSEAESDELAETWRRTRKPGETSIDVSRTIYSNGTLFSLPITKTNKYRLEAHEVCSSNPEPNLFMCDYSKNPPMLWDDGDALVTDWKRNSRELGERDIKVAKTIHPSGSVFPITKAFDCTLDEDAIWESVGSDLVTTTTPRPLTIDDERMTQYLERSKGDNDYLFPMRPRILAFDAEHWTRYLESLNKDDE